MSVQVKGTVILHVSYAAKQDQELGKTIVKLIKNEKMLTPFATAVALALSRIHRFEDAVFDILKVTDIDLVTLGARCRCGCIGV